MNIAEQVLRSADEIVSSRLNEVHFDKTEIATVLSKVKNKENVYWLNNGSIKYEANALNNSEYSDGAQVYVTIINGDYNQDKIIIGSYDNTNDDPVYLYEDPFDRFGINTTISINIDQIVDDEIEDGIKWHKYEDQDEFSLTALGTPTYIGAKVSLETNIEDSVEPYGFYIQLLGEIDEILYETVVDSRYITGNPYRLFSNMFHSFVFTLPSNFLITDVKSIRLKFYQDENIIVDWKNITLFLGYDLKSDIIVNSEEQVFAATDALHSYYNVQTGKKEQRFQGFNEFLPKVSIKPSEQGEGTIKSLEASDNWGFYSLATSKNEDNAEAQPSSWNNQNQEISSYLDWGENGPIKNIGIYHNVIRFKANSTFIAKELKGLTNGQSYKIKFQYYADPEALFKNSGYVQNIGIYKFNKENSEEIYFYDIPNDQRIKGKAEKLAAAAGEWHEYSIEFIYEDENKYIYYFGFEPSFNTNTIQDYCCLYVDNFQLFETVIVQPKEILGSWIKDGQVYSKNNPYPSQTTQETSDEELPEISLQWYQYSPNHKDEGMGIAWEKLDNETNWSLPIYDIPLKDENGEQLKDDNGNPLTDKQWHYVDITKSEARFRLLVKYSDQEYKSNVLVLTNDGFQGAKSSVENGDLVLTLNDDGIYLYDHMAQLYTDEETEKILTASSRKGEDDLKPSNAIVWFIPKESTMIAPPTRQTKKKDGSDDVDYYYWDYYPEKHYNEEPQLENFNDYVLEGRYTTRSLNSYYIIEKKCDDLSQNFKIRKSYQPNCVNNGIVCYIYETDRDIIPREGYRTTFTPQFVSANNSGIEASLGIKLVSDKGYFGGDNIEDLKLKGIVYDKDSQEIEEQPDITWATTIANPLYLSTWNPGNAIYNPLSGDVSIKQNNKQFQTVFRSNGKAIGNNGIELGSLQSDPSHYPIYSIEVTRPLCSYDNANTTDGWASRIDINDFPYEGRNGTSSSTILFEMTPERWRRNGEFAYIFSENQTMKIHFVYTTEEINRPSDDKKHLLNRIVFKGFSQTNDSKIFKEFEETDYDTIKHTTANATTYEDVKLKEKITEIYIKLFAGYTGNNYGSAPYMNFIKFNDDETKERIFNLKYIHAMTTEDTTQSNEKNTITLNKDIKTAITLYGYCNWNSEIVGKAIKLSSYYSIPYFPTDTIYHLDGATQISYSSFGDNPKPSRSIDYTLYNWNGKTQGIIASNNYYLEIPEQDCPAKVENKWIEKEQAFRHRIIMPTLASSEKSVYTINIYNASPGVDNNNKQILKKGTTLLAQYPLILLRNTYAFKEINAWGGSTVTTEDYVLSPMIGAGTKNSQNQFTGVIMGTSSEFPQIGLYGFQNGVATFGFKEDGSCFIGSEENGGNEVVIRAKDFDLDSEYIKIDKNNILLKNGGKIIGPNYAALSINEGYNEEDHGTTSTFAFMTRKGEKDQYQSSFNIECYHSKDNTGTVIFQANTNTNTIEFLGSGGQGLWISKEDYAVNLQSTSKHYISISNGGGVQLHSGDSSIYIDNSSIVISARKVFINNQEF